MNVYEGTSFRAYKSLKPPDCITMDGLTRHFGSEFAEDMLIPKKKLFSRRRPNPKQMLLEEMRANIELLFAGTHPEIEN